MNTISVKAFGIEALGEEVIEITIQRRDIKEKDVEIEILYCGVCHSDMHHVHGDWGLEKYPLVPGHEIVGKVTKVGK